MKISLDRILDASDFASFGGGFDEDLALLCTETGEIYYNSDGVDEPLPDDIYESDKYLSVTRAC